MKVICKTSCAGYDYSLVEGQEYDLPEDVVKSLGALVEPVKAAKPKAKPIEKGPRKAAPKASTKK